MDCAKDLNSSRGIRIDSDTMNSRYVAILIVLIVVVSPTHCGSHYIPDAAAHLSDGGDVWDLGLFSVVSAAHPGVHDNGHHPGGADYDSVERDQERSVLFCDVPDKGSDLS